MAWLVLLVAGLLEVVWASALPSTDGFTRPVPTAVFVAAMVGSMYLLARATQTIPLGTAYAVWVGIGAVGAAIYGIAARGEPASLGRVAFLSMLIVSIVGLKFAGD